ncbi:Nitrosoguanidine resistance protein SNG1 [Wickerhamomyces ciferrii]|uniref:Nitrosoguanidine resistance protein SNG1 n=1 Tax=Wickerhamomyces ciferrii (strain ATCC 14091 / BCRC 22168 / CBS 111 / JCM 3599 / NBRC 0793 / NRRL Y-1031 F-60-10) TaxID=1206466 RepID=K0KPR0_WICCF|nr:Nitrosoguanidine resistance protein SNG1 [Wickerhamomyces ciferrii]CCH43153.1 Nitrosoguanidine resistance protein SNG1 [Wickerhamomyces ciferrii]
MSYKDSVDPLEEATYRTQSHNDHDIVGGSQMPPVHISSGQRSRSNSLINYALGRVEQDKPNEVIEEHPDESEESKEHEQEKEQEQNEPLEQGLTKTSTTKSEKRARHERNKSNFWKVVVMFAKVYLIMFVLFVGILSIYWGSLYDRPSHYHKINYLVVLDEDLEAQQPPSLYSLTLQNLLTNEAITKYGTFEFQNGTTFNELAQKHNNTNRDEVIRQVHHQNYWGGIYVPKNLTQDYYQALTTNSSFNGTIEFIYETGRNPQGVASYIVSIMKTIEKQFVKSGSQSIVQRLISQLSQDQLSTILQSHSELLQPLWWHWTDNRPNPGSIVITVVQIGLIYLLVLSFHQFNFASSTHEYILKNIHTRQYLLYHYTVSQLAYIILSLVYSLMTLAFKVDHTKTFGKSGFLVEWVFVYLTMAALGGVNENAAIQIFARYKPIIGFWIVFFLVINVSPVFSPMIVMNRFYRYGYAMPLYNGNELLKIIFLDTYKGNIGRNVGVLIAWIVLMNIILPFNLRNVRNYTRAVNAKAKKVLDEKK